MIIYKAIGAGCILGSALTLYFEMQRYQTKRIEQLEAFLSLVEYIKNQIECYLLPIDEILLSCDESLLIKCGAEQDAKFRDLYELVCAIKIFGDEDAELMIASFSKDFGTQYRREQIKSCDLFCDGLRAEIEKLKDKNIKERKVRLALCLCISFSIVLMLI